MTDIQQALDVFVIGGGVNGTGIARDAVGRGYSVMLAEMHDRFIPDNGLRMSGRHHEIYFSDFRRVAPEKLRTLLRQPVESTIVP